MKEKKGENNSAELIATRLILFMYKGQTFY